jgi:hypothetical protein
MRTKIWMGLAAATMLASIASAGTAQAQAVGENIFQKMFGLSNDQPQINYSERAPLVIPGKTDLRQPKGKKAKNANWPVDPDEKKRQEADLPTPLTPKNGDTRMTPDQLRAAGRLPGDAPAPAEDTSMLGRNEAKLSSVPLKPDELRREHLTFKTNSSNGPLVPGQEPPRQSLIDPPEGFRKPLASAPVDGSEPLPSEAGQDVPWYEKLWKTPKVK